MRGTRSEQGECEVFSGEGPDPLARVCFRPAVARYAALGGGFMHLCAEHAKKHEWLVDEYGERWDGTAWVKKAVTNTGGSGGR